MKTRTVSAFLVAMMLASCSATKKSGNDLAVSVPIDTQINLTEVVNDKVPVIINPGRFTSETVTYHLPKVVQGTYSVSDFGKYIDEFKAYDYKGNVLSFKKTDTNTWIINNAVNLDYIKYFVNDTFDVEVTGGIGGDTPFSPAGTNIEPDDYVLNLHGFIGYFDSLKNNQYKLEVTAPADFVRSSALQNAGSTTSADGKTITTTYLASRYFDITDNPMMYGKFSVDEFQVGDIKVVLSVYSPNNLHSASSLKDAMYKMMVAQKAFLGDINSTSRYDIFLYLSKGDEKSPKGFGALEHHTSTVVVMPENMPKDELEESMIETVSHEFFHIVTPLSVHSEDVHYFDYNNPTFSKHLWMYEGVTEYFANLFQVNQGLISEDAFYNNMMVKIQTSMQMNDAMSFTEMSENVLDDPYAKQYYNVYQKGALIGMCVDILMREESNGQRGILSLMKELSNKYGKNKPFEDDKLIDEIVSMTYPSLRTFFDLHVIGKTPINYNEFFDKLGLEIAESKVETGYIMNAGALIVGGDGQKGTVFFNDLVLDNSFWAQQGVLPNDVIKEVDGVVVTLQTANQIFQDVFMWKPGQDIEMKLDRNGQEIIIKTKTTPSYTNGQGLMSKEDATESQIKIRDAWLRG
jgi:predicted metalloprotease with PDZ domain